jgi:LuxR family transcriptional regulator, maltose regulon positive regulatory protein
LLPKQVLNFQAPDRPFAVNNGLEIEVPRDTRLHPEEPCMLQGDALPRSPLVAELDRIETTQVLEAAKALIEVAPRKLSWRDHTVLAAYVALHRPDPAECHQLLAHSLAASPIASQAFARFPTQMAELCIEALRSGAETVRELTKQYSRQPSQKPEGGRPWPFKVFVLGRFQVVKGDAPIRSSRRQQRKPLELLQALIAFGGTEVGAGRLTDALWPDSEGDAGYHALESALYRLRQLLGAPSAVAMAGGKLTLDRRQVWVDMWAFESELRGCEADDNCPERLARLRELYGGHFLAHDMEKTWAVEKRQTLREKFGRTIRDFARTYEKQALWQEAAGVYQIGLDVDSLAEEFHRGLIMCHRELGDHAAAVAAYRRCSELLLKGLGVQPSSKTLALYQSVRRDATSQAV